MGVQIRITRNGFPAAQRGLKGLSGQVVEQSTNRVRDRAKNLVPVDSGETQSNIRSVRLADNSWAVESTRPSTDSDFDVPAYLEFKIKPYLRPALEEERGTFIGTLARIIDRLV